MGPATNRREVPMKDDLLFVAFVAACVLVGFLHSPLGQQAVSR